MIKIFKCYINCIKWEMHCKYKLPSFYILLMVALNGNSMVDYSHLVTIPLHHKISIKNVKLKI